MKQRFYALLLALGLLPLFGMAQQAGDLAFVGFNADGDDDFAVVTFVDLAPNTTLYFRDSEWNGTVFGADEQAFAWNTGATTIPAGTVVAFNNLSAASTATLGSIPSNTSMGLGNSGEAVFIYKADSLNATPTIITAIGNGNEASSFGTLMGTGLVLGSTAILLPNGTDIGVYKGARSGLDKNGYTAALNNIAVNWITQDATGDQHNDGTAPDLPFDLNPFTFGNTGDVTAPTIVSVTVQSAKIWAIRFSEPVNAALAVADSNYLITPTLTIDSLHYNVATNTVLLYQSGMSNGIEYSLIISDIADTSGNIMIPFTAHRLIFNSTQPKLLFTEIMYNAGENLDSLEFFEIINVGPDTANVGGLVVRDVNPTNGAVGQINLVLPSQKLAPNGILLVAPDGDGARNFYNKTFIDLGFVGNALGNGGEALVIKNSLGVVIDSVNYDDVAPWPTAADGTGPSLERKNLTGNSSDAANWRASTTPADTIPSTNILASPGTFTSFAAATIAFAKTHSVFTEGQSNATIVLNIDQAPQQTVTVQLQTINLTVNTLQELSAVVTQLTFPAGTSQSQNIQFNILDNATVQADRYFAIRLSTITNGVAGDVKEHIVYIKDNDQPAIVGTKEIQLKYENSYAIGDGGSAEIVAFDSISNRLFVVNSTQNKLEILNFNGPKAVTKFKTIDMAAYGIGLQSVAAKNGLLAVAVDVANFGNGKVVFFNANGDFQKQVEVGNLPDMVTFTPDGKQVLTANEGQPNSTYTIDPEGSVSVINLPANIADLKQADVTTIRFNNFDAILEDLKEEGLRIYGPNATVSKDLEPEYIAVSPDSRVAWVTLQENNAIATISLEALFVIEIVPLGYKDYSLSKNTLDASDRTDSVLFANYPIFGMYQPDAIATFRVGGRNYLITANEGDARAYDALEEEVAFGSPGFKLDSIAFPNGAILKSNVALGRLNVTNQLGDFDGDGDFDAAYTLGGRSFSILDNNGNLRYDSGDEFERITAADPTYKTLFNASNQNNTRKNRSDNKGPEPEGVTTAVINNKVYAFIALERTGGVMVYNVTNPDSAVFVQYINNRDLGPNEGGDLGPEGLIYLSPSASPNDTAMLIVANEISGTLTFYQLSDLLTAVDDIRKTPTALIAFPNPASSQVFLEREDDYKIIDMQGRIVQNVQRQNVLDVSHLSNGIYFVVRKDGAVAKVAVQR